MLIQQFGAAGDQWRLRARQDLRRSKDRVVQRSGLASQAWRGVPGIIRSELTKRKCADGATVLRDSKSRFGIRQHQIITR